MTNESIYWIYIQLTWQKRQQNVHIHVPRRLLRVLILERRFSSRHHRLTRWRWLACRRRDGGRPGMWTLTSSDSSTTCWRRGHCGRGGVWMDCRGWWVRRVVRDSSSSWWGYWTMGLIDTATTAPIPPWNGDWVAYVTASWTWPESGGGKKEQLLWLELHALHNTTDIASMPNYTFTRI